MDLTVKTSFCRVGVEMNSKILLILCFYFNDRFSRSQKQETQTQYTKTLDKLWILALSNSWQLPTQIRFLCNVRCCAADQESGSDKRSIIQFHSLSLCFMFHSLCCVLLAQRQILDTKWESAVSATGETQELTFSLRTNKKDNVNLTSVPFFSDNDDSTI